MSTSLLPSPHFRDLYTPWFTRDQKPVREGLYQVQLHPSWRVVPFEWRRGRWHVGSNGMFCGLPINLRAYPEFQWRGLTGPTI